MKSIVLALALTGASAARALKKVPANHVGKSILVGRTGKEQQFAHHSTKDSIHAPPSNDDITDVALSLAKTLGMNFENPKRWGHLTDKDGKFLQQKEGQEEKRKLAEHSDGIMSVYQSEHAGTDICATESWTVGIASDLTSADDCADGTNSETIVTTSAPGWTQVDAATYYQDDTAGNSAFVTAAQYWAECSDGTQCQRVARGDADTDEMTGSVADWGETSYQSTKVMFAMLSKNMDGWDYVDAFGSADGTCGKSCTASFTYDDADDDANTQSKLSMMAAFLGHVEEDGMEMVFFNAAHDVMTDVEWCVMSETGATLLDDDYIDTDSGAPMGDGHLKRSANYPDGTALTVYAFEPYDSSWNAQSCSSTTYVASYSLTVDRGTAMGFALDMDDNATYYISAIDSGVTTSDAKGTMCINTNRDYKDTLCNIDDSFWCCASEDYDQCGDEVGYCESQEVKDAVGAVIFIVVVLPILIVLVSLCCICICCAFIPGCPIHNCRNKGQGGQAVAPVESKGEAPVVAMAMEA